MDYAFRNRPLNALELEVLRLVLSTFRDGSGQIVRKGPNNTMPGFRDFERALAAVLRATAPEGKGVFDVIVPTEGQPFGISCKMTKTQPPRNQSSFMELANASAKFRDHLLSHQITYATEPMLAGPAVIDLVSSWHEEDGKSLDIAQSKYCVLAHNPSWSSFELLCFPLNLRLKNPRGEVEWLYEGKAVNGYIEREDGRRHRLWQYYATSGGQLKYYPPLEWADWTTPAFTLEHAPTESLLAKANEYFGDIWPSEWANVPPDGAPVLDEPQV